MAPLNSRRCLFFAWMAMGIVSAAAAKTYEVTPDDDWFQIVSGDHLRPGDEVVLSPGVYRDARRLVIGHRGTAEQPVVIRAGGSSPAVLHRPDARQNSINIVGAQHLILSGIEITGGSSGIRLMKSDRHACRFVTIREMHIHHVGGPAVTANSPGNAYQGLIFRRNHVHHTAGHGEGFYLGSNNDADGKTTGYMFDSLVEGNYIHDLNGPSISQGDGIEIKDGSYNNVVRDNVIHDTNYPGVIVYGTDGNAANLIERNVIWNSGDHGIQAAAEAIIRNNVVFGCGGDGIHSHTHQSARVGNLRILHNTVLCDSPGGSAVRISLAEDARLTGPVVIANNALYASNAGFALRIPEAEKSGPDVKLAGNAGCGTVEGLPRRVSEAVWNPAGQRDRDLDSGCRPTIGSTLLGRAIGEFTVADDFDAMLRGANRDVGAYLYHPAGHSGWTIKPGFKPLPEERAL